MFREVCEEEGNRERREHLLLIRTSKPATRPIVDFYTERLTAAVRKAISQLRSKGTIVCSCGATSPNIRLLLPNGMVADVHCIHRMVFQRNEVPHSELDKINSLRFGEEKPTDSELILPPTTNRGWG